MPENINPNSDYDFVNRADINTAGQYPLFFKRIELIKFRHIKSLSIDFNTPITVISGSNKSGKTTALLSIACSHYNFKRRNVTNGSLERNTWGDILKFTQFDRQDDDWEYKVSYREGTQAINNKRGQRKHLTNKWNGVAKKESQIGTPTANKPNGGRSVVLIDLDRMIPSRSLPRSAFNKIRMISNPPAIENIKKVYLSYVLESSYAVTSILKTSDKEIFGYTNAFTYSSFNTASGEDTLSRIISDIVDAERNSLILIDEIEIGLHPKIQRRLMDVIFHESKKNKKQFIITTHSSTILSSVDPKGRIFIENSNNTFKAISNISINAALSKMDSSNYPLIDLFVEDEIAEKIIKKSIEFIQCSRSITGFNSLINILIIGSASDTFNCFKLHKKTFEKKKVKCGYACVLDGDQRTNFPVEDGLFHLYSDLSPEKFLIQSYLASNNNDSLNYHLDSNPHCLFGKMVEFDLAIDISNAFDICWNTFVKTKEGQLFLNKLSDFLINECTRFSPSL